MNIPFVGQYGNLINYTYQITLLTWIHNQGATKKTHSSRFYVHVNISVIAKEKHEWRFNLLILWIVAQEERVNEIIGLHEHDCKKSLEWLLNNSVLKKGVKYVK